MQFLYSIKLISYHIKYLNYLNFQNYVISHIPKLLIFLSTERMKIWMENAVSIAGIRIRDVA